MSSVNDVTLKGMKHNGAMVKKWYHNGVKVFSSGALITYVCNGEKYTEEVDSGASALNPSFTPKLEGATFLGWSLLSNDTTVEDEVIVEDDPFTLYAVFKYNDVVLKSGGSYYDYGAYDTDMDVNNVNRCDVLTGISGKKYERLQADVSVPSLKCAWWALSCWAQSTLRVYNGSTSVSAITLRETHTLNGAEDQMEQDKHPCSFGKSATVTLNLAKADNQALAVTYDTDTFSGTTYVGNVKAFGRTVVG